MFRSKSLISIALLCLCCALLADGAEIPAPQDTLYPGMLTLSVDLADLDRRLFNVRESVPAKPGPLTLLYPQWLPGTHGPNGPINLLTGLIITARGRRLPWLRDPVNMYAFHIDVPPDADQSIWNSNSPRRRLPNKDALSPLRKSLGCSGTQWCFIPPAITPAGYRLRPT